MIEKRDLDVFPLCDALCDYFNVVANRFAERINNYIEEREEEVEDGKVIFEVLDDGEFFLFEYVDSEVVTESINDELRNWGADITVTDYEIDEEAGYIQFKIE